MNTSSLVLATLLTFGFTSLCYTAETEDPAENSLLTKATLLDGRVEEGRVFFRNDKLEPIEGDRIQGDYKPFDGFGVRAKPGGICVAFSENLVPLLYPELIAASSNLEAGVSEGTAAVIEPFDWSCFKAVAGSTGMLIALEPKTPMFRLGYGLRTDVLKFGRSVSFRGGTLRVVRKENGKSVGSDIYEFSDDARILRSKDEKALVSVGIVHRFDLSEKAEPNSSDAPATKPPGESEVVAGPVFIPLAMRGGTYRFGKGKLSQWLAALESDPNDRLTFFGDSAFRTERTKALYVSPVAGTGKIQVATSVSMYADSNEKPWILIPAVGSNGEFPSTGPDVVSVPYKRVPDLPLETLKKYLASEDWICRACASWVMGEKAYREASPLLLDTIKKETNWYAACFEAAALSRLNDKARLAELQPWLAQGNDRVRQEVKKVLTSPKKAIPVH